jgi:hypothetical protein
MNTILPTENQDWGFWGTMREHAADAWPIAFTAIHNATSTDATSPNSGYKCAKLRIRSVLT